MIRRSFEDTTYPLPFVTPPPAPRPSFSDRLQRSSHLFPKKVSSPRIMNNINRDYMNMNNSTNCSDAEIASKEAVNISSSSELRPSKKKTVRFNNKAILHRMDSPAASDMETSMKQQIWYNSNDYDHFKYEAAKHAGVKIVRYNSASQKANQGHHFIMMGDFDSREGTELVVSNNGTTNSDKAAAGKCYYNENEYKDHVNGRGEVICKRGLGYHFSRNRKKSRVVTRSAVVAWQKTLLRGYNIPSSSSNSNQPASQDDIPMARSKSNTSGDGGRDANKLDKSRVMLELVSTKCSRVARAEAKWRGSVDYRVAYPERHDDCDSSSGGDSDSKLLKKSPVEPGTHLKRNSNVSSTMSKQVFGTSVENSSSVAATKKRLCGGVVDLTGADSHHKRQKTTSRGGCGANRGNELSPATIGYLSGILHTEV